MKNSPNNTKYKQDNRAIAGKPHDTTVNFNAYSLSIQYSVICISIAVWH